MASQDPSGGCLCRACTWVATGKPLYRLICHCRSCRVAVGSNAVPWVTYQAADLHLSSDCLREFESSPGVVRTFCGRCGTSLTYTSAARRGEIDVTQGSLDEPDCLGVTGHIWMQDAAAWEHTAPRLPTAHTSGPASGPPLSHPVRTWVTNKAVKGRDSAIEGKGVFAVEPIAAGEVVEVKSGHVVDRTTLRSLPERLQNSEIGVADGLHLVALSDAEYDAVMLYINHSCQPNVGVRGNIVFVAMRDIAAGEELTIDYAMIDDHDESMTCHCSAPNCRRVITGQDYRIPELRHRYGHFLSAYLIDKLAAER